MTKMQRDILIAMMHGATLEHRRQYRVDVHILISKGNNRIIRKPTFNLLVHKNWIHIECTKHEIGMGPIDIYTITITGKADAKDGSGL